MTDSTPHTGDFIAWVLLEEPSDDIPTLRPFNAGTHHTRHQAGLAARAVMDSRTDAVAYAIRKPGEGIWS